MNWAREDLAAGIGKKKSWEFKFGLKGNISRTEDGKERRLEG